MVDNLGFELTVKPMLLARNWQLVHLGCLGLKKELANVQNEIRLGGCLPSGVDFSFSYLEAILTWRLRLKQMYLMNTLIKSPAFTQAFQITAGGDTRTVFVELKNDNTLYLKDRLTWCLYNLTRDSKAIRAFSISVVVQHLDEFLATCSKAEAARMDEDVYYCVSDLAAANQILEALHLQRPRYQVPRIRGEKPGQLSLYRTEVSLDGNGTEMRSSGFGLGQFVQPLDKLKMPKGKKDPTWLRQADQVRQNLDKLWDSARQGYGIWYNAKGKLENLPDPRLDMMRLSRSLEHRSRLAIERQYILEQTHNVDGKAASQGSPHDQSEGFRHSEIPYEPRAFRTQQPPNVKVKTRPEELDASADRMPLSEESAGRQVRTEVVAVSLNPHVLYTLKSKSISLKVLDSMFPDRYVEGIGVQGKIDWLDFVAMMTSLGFEAEHRGGSAFTFKGEIRVPVQLQGNDASVPRAKDYEIRKRSITVHRPHPNSEMVPSMLQGLGRRCSRRFGWERAHFAGDA